ncbi:MAG TPA: DUF6580 family putative transport protein [Puia sp.]|jgi:hypothetical protein|nr:DUF6580 family putative transport protein [Puia sp.]
MSIPRFNPRTATLYLLIVLMAATRVVFTLGFQHGPLGNFSTVEAMALFGGAYFSHKTKAFVFPLLTLWLSDLLLNRFLYYHEWRLFYQDFYWTYGAFALMVITGSLLLKKVTVKNILTASAVVVLIHWIITDLGVWLGGTLYPKNAAGWGACLVAAIPYEGYILAGTLLYCAVLFGLFEGMQRKYSSLQINQS